MKHMVLERWYPWENLCYVLTNNILSLLVQLILYSSKENYKIKQMK